MRCSFDGFFEVKRGQIIKIVRVVSDSNPLRVSAVENLTTGQKQRSKIEGIMMADGPVELANPIIERVISSESNQYKTTFEIEEMNEVS